MGLGLIWPGKLGHFVVFARIQRMRLKTAHATRTIQCHGERELGCGTAQCDAERHFVT